MEPKNTACLGALLIAFSLLNSTEAGADTAHEDTVTKEAVKDESGNIVSAQGVRFHPPLWRLRGSLVS